MEHTEGTPAIDDTQQPESEPLPPANPVTAELGPIPVAPADPVPEADQPRRNAMRRTIATLDLKVAITVDENTRLSLDTTEKIENDLQAVRVQTRKTLENKTKGLNDLLNEGEPPEKLMRCGVNAAVWTDSIS
jgi:hypothetical protein